ncbi:MAG: triose-phosphate isomerase [Anaerolineae bacterium]|nr:triose-phosphate isomerase [Anaerolineae bacterium]
MAGRKPLALSNWKMAMTIAEGRAFVGRLLQAADEAVEEVEVVLCPPCTALYAVGEAIRGTPLRLGAQDVSVHVDSAHTGEVSAALLADVGCEWVLLGHWEVRRHLGEDDAVVNRKMHRALAAGLRPLLSVGEARGRQYAAREELDRQLGAVLAGALAADVARMAFLYEPEWTIGVEWPAPAAHVEAGCREIRAWLRRAYGGEVAEAARIIYGGSVREEEAPALLQAPDLDGLGASRRGRDPEAWAGIVRLIARTKARRPH